MTIVGKTAVALQLGHESDPVGRARQLTGLNAGERVVHALSDLADPATTKLQCFTLVA